MPARRRIEATAGVHAVRQWADSLGAPVAGRARGVWDAQATRGDDATQTAPAPSTASGAALPATAGLDRRTLATAVRFTLEELTACAPGHAVEVRVPPHGVTQAVSGTVHRRGTPPSVVETDAATWLALATGRLSWSEALSSGDLHASGERCDLSPYLPLVHA